MASKASRAAKARSAAEGAWTHPYVRRVVEDPELRANVLSAVDSARAAYDRLNHGKAPSKQLMEDKKLHKEMQKAAESLRDAANAMREGPKKKRRSGGFVKLLLVAFVGAAIALAVSEDLRNKVLDLLFGAEEEFDYTSTTTPPPAAPAGEPVSSTNS